MKPRNVMAVALLLCLPGPARAAADDRADGVWAPFVPLKVNGGTVETLKHRFTVAESALPSQIFIKPDLRELPLALRAAGAKPTDTALAAIGRGSRLRAPMRLEAEVGGKRVAAQVTRRARALRQAKGEVAYRAGLAVGPFDVDLDVQYECDGAMTVKLTYERARKPTVGTLELVIDLAGPVDLAYRPPPADPKTGAVSLAGLDFTLPGKDGVVWDSSAGDAHRDSDPVPYLFVGSGDGGFTWLCDGGEGWVIDRLRPTMVMKRDELGRLTWHVLLVNSPTDVKGKQVVEFALLAHPARPKDPDYRKTQWLAWRSAEDRRDRTVLSGRAANPGAASPLTLAVRRRMIRAAQGLAREGRVNNTLLPAGPLATLESLARDCEMSGTACADILSAKQDNVDLYPLSAFCVTAGTWTGLTGRVRSNVRQVSPGDDPAFDRQILGRALLHDVGVAVDGVDQPFEYLRLLQALREFGYFEEQGTEFIPYWRSGRFVRFGEAFDSAGPFELTEKDPSAHTYVSIYRRRFEKDGKKGYKVMFVIMNERDEPARQRLYLLNPEKLLGPGGSTLTGLDVIKSYDFGTIPDDSDWRREKLTQSWWMFGATGLMDLEGRGFVKASTSKGQTAAIFGPIYVQRHDYRIVYGHWTAEEAKSK